MAFPCAPRLFRAAPCFPCGLLHLIGAGERPLQRGVMSLQSRQDSILRQEGIGLPQQGHPRRCLFGGFLRFGDFSCRLL